MINKDIRRKNAQYLMKLVNGPSNFARKIGKDASQITQLLGEKPVKNIGPQIAREIEISFDKERGWLDIPHPNLWNPEAVDPFVKIIESYHKIKFIHWHELANHLYSETQDKETEWMITEQDVSESAIMVEVDTDQFAPYINRGELAIIDPEKPVLDENVLVRIGKTFHFFHYSVMDSPRLLPIQQPGRSEVKLSDKMDYQIIGQVVHIRTPGRSGK